MRPTTVLALACACVAWSATAQAAILTFNAASPAGNAGVRASWLAAAGDAQPDVQQDFESYVDGQSLDGVPLGGGLTITSSGAAVVEDDAGAIGGSNPVGKSLMFEVTSLVSLVFSSPVSYVGFLDIDQAGFTAASRVVLTDGTSQLLVNETTGVMGDSAEFFGIISTGARIARIDLQVTGDGLWALDNVEYGVPEPTSAVLLGAAVAGLLVRRRRSPA